MKDRRSGTQKFDDHFLTVYQERWPGLRAALLAPAQKKVLSNPFGQGLQDYSLDGASIWAAEQLQVEAGHAVADLCASPGGKALVSLFLLRGQAADWHLNDISPKRVARLKAVMHDCLPQDLLSQQVRFTCSDASRWGLRRAEQLDRVMVDAPCSGERHLMAEPRELDRWSEKGSKRLSVRQHALLCAGLDILRPGGRLVYATCSISPIENDHVIQKLMQSRKAQFEVLPPQVTQGEPTEHGWLVLPDAVPGHGPIYFSVLRKLSAESR